MHRFSLFVAVALLASPAFAQQANNPISFEALSRAKNGQWAEYTMSMKGQAQSIKMRYALVEKSDKTIGLEVDSNTPMGPMLMHMQFTSGGADTWNMTKAVAKIGEQKQYMTAEQLKTGDVKKSDTPGKLVGTESVTVPAGKFEAKHYTRKVSMPGAGGETTLDVWMSDKVEPTGLVKMAASNGVEAVLTATGNDAKSQLPLDDKAGAGGKGAEKPAAAPSGSSAKPAKP
jgi:hypothetical protein